MDIARSMGGPIPGQSLTKEPGASPWEKPPQFTDLDEAMSFLIQNMTEPKVAHKLLALMEAGIPITSILDTLLMQGFMDGKWTPDLAILLAKPLTALLIKIARMYDIEPTTGAEDTEDVEEDFIRLADAHAAKAGKAPPVEAAPKPPAGGLMSPKGV